QHSLHLPLSVDTDIVTELAERVEGARPERIVLLPTLWLGHSPHHRFLASLTLDVRPYMDVIKGLCGSLVHMGFRKVLLLNGHGGNEIAAKAAMRELKTEHQSLPDLRIGFASYWTLGEKTLREMRESPLGGVGHACEMETSMLMHLPQRHRDTEEITGPLRPGRFWRRIVSRCLPACHSFRGRSGRWRLSHSGPTSTRQVD